MSESTLNIIWYAWLGFLVGLFIVIVAKAYLK